ncbi:MAG: alanine dehydrogenase [Candidatus Methylomirabilales bacterium]
MVIGVPREIKDEEHRVAMMPPGVHILTAKGHQVLIEQGAGRGAGTGDEQYAKAGAHLVANAADVYARAEMICKVKEPQPSEYAHLKAGQILFAYLHLAPSPELTQALVERQVVAIAYETVETADGRKPLLEPMSEIAGRMALPVAAYYLSSRQGGRGVLLSGVTGVPPATVTILGGGIVGYNAARMAAGMGAWVYLLDVDTARMRSLEELLPPNVTTLMSNRMSVEECVRRADVLVGAVLIPGAKAPRLVTREMLKLMKPGSVIVDVSVDQGGCVETTHPTTHSDPVYRVDGILHYCVANMPGAFGRTATFALTNVTLPYVVDIADQGWKGAAQANPEIAKGLNIVHGHVTHPAVADAHGMEYVPWDAATNE